MSFTGAPVTRFLVIGLIASSIGATLLDIKHYFYIIVDLHLWRHAQWWRLLSYQLCYTNSTEVLFAANVLYQMRTIERMWGPRKYASFILVMALLSTLVTPILLAFVVRPLSRGYLNYLPAGPTPVIFAVLAQFHALVPMTYQYRVSASSTPPTNRPVSSVAERRGSPPTITLSNKSFLQFLALHLTAMQFPGSLLGAGVGWVLGRAWRMDLLPQAATLWRVPRWLVGGGGGGGSGGGGGRSNARFEQLRRRLEGEVDTNAVATGVRGDNDAQAHRRRTMGQEILHQVREAF